MNDLWQFEHEAYQNGFERVCGIDEAGRGPLAGPVFAAAVILPPDAVIEGLDDSKKLSEKKREALFDQIIAAALDYEIAFATEKEIDQHNILNATFLAMKRAVAGLEERPDLALVDGNRDPGLPIESVCIVKGDAKSASIAAASILAKVSRDRFMKQMAEQYPQYHFEKHKGYPTKEHYAMILEHGPCAIHRTTFLKTLFKHEA
ncbi:ribonuclease HII [Candidatus Soleaferrea massiliensis]|uniref:ribonuclease HII n=1 Tax=Candidatus Soleaferrea massiliensis TaxID=1470354 RepID=UPI00058C5533|nr:ribonuclease HII [Candidatus Soleaferrea massiliensis]